MLSQFWILDFLTSTSIFYKQHFYKQRQAKIGKKSDKW